MNAGPAWPANLVLAGAGKMGGALLRGWLTNGLPPAAVRIVDPHLPPDLARFCDDIGIATGAPVQPPEVLVLAVKPQTFTTEAASFAPLAGRQTLVVSVLAGKTLASLRAALPGAGAIVRAMPNLPAAVGRGAAGLAAEPEVDTRQHALATRLLEAVGLAEWVDESLMDAVTAVSGSGPAYVFYLVECLEAAGIRAGLPADVAARLARATVEGAGALLAADPDLSPGAMRAAVTSPGGTTAAALEVLRAEEGGLSQLLADAVKAARQRAAQLGG